MNIPIIFLLPHKDHIIVRHRAAAIVGEAHGVDTICPILACARAGYFGIRTYGLITLRLTSIREFEGLRQRRRATEQ